MQINLGKILYSHLIDMVLVRRIMSIQRLKTVLMQQKGPLGLEVIDREAVKEEKRIVVVKHLKT